MALSLDEALGVAALDEGDKSIHINLATRQVVIPESEKLFGVESDDAVEVKHIVIDGRYTDAGKDISELSWRVNFRNANGDKNVFPVTKVTAGDDSVEFDWVIRRSVVAYKGSIDFVVCAFGKDSDGKLTPEWNSTLGHGDVLEGLEVDVEDIGGDEILDELKNLQVSMKALSDSAAKSASDAKAALDAIPADYTELSEDVEQLKEDLSDLATVGKNLFNQNGTRHLNSLINFAGDIVAGDSIVYELPIHSGTYVSNMPTNSVYKIACITEDGVATIITPSTTSDFEEHFTLPDGTVKVYMSFWSGRDRDTESTDYIIFKKGMIVAGNTLPDKYIPYYKKLNDVIKVNESNIEDGTKLNKYIDTEALVEETSNTLFNGTLNLIDSSSYVRGTLSTSGVVVESSDSTANYIYTIKIPDGTFIGMNAVPQIICFYDENMGFLEYKQLASTSDDTISVNIPTKGKYAKLSYWYGRGIDGSFEHVTHLKDISVTVDSVPFSAIKREPVMDSSKKISGVNLCDGFELNSKLAKGIKWYILGDSRSVDTAYTAKFYHDYLCEKHKFIRKKNLAVSGARIRSADTAYHSLLEQYPSVGDDADLITVYAGINDYGQDNPTEIGTEGTEDLSTFYGAFESLITNLITNHPTAKIVVITPIPQFNFEINNTIIWGDRNDTNSLGKSLDDYCNVIKKICRKYGVFVKDACYESGITPRIASQRSEYFKDGLHHNEKGQLVLAEYLSDIFNLLDC
mgnify:CR=1 FL=1